jgi:dihydroflavonol-4-reductase
VSQTVFVTGATGYIAKHLVLKLLNAGHSVVGSARSQSREAELQDAVRPHLNDPAALERLRVVALDLSKDDGWDLAMQGVDVLMHTASPFPLVQPKDENDLIRPAVDGALRAVKAAQKAGITRVIMTSSSAAVMNTTLPTGRTTHDESDWTDLNHPASVPYVKSKTLAERAVWDWAAKDAPEMQITMINPVFVQGAPLDNNFGTSVDVIKRFMGGKDPMVPKIGFPIVDVRDIAEMHIRAMDRPESIGKRFIGSDRFIWFQEMTQILKADHPDRKIPTRVAPNMMIKMLALFDPSLRSILPSLGKHESVSNDRSRAILGMDFHDIRDSIRATGAYLADNKLV